MPAVPDSPGGLQTVRVVCISDTHNANPADGAFKLPKGDVLIHAGDLTTQGTYRELQKTLSWIKNADYAAKIVIAGQFLCTYVFWFSSQSHLEICSVSLFDQSMPSLYIP